MSNKSYDIHKIIEALQGTCMDLAGAIHQVYEDEVSEDDISQQDMEILELEIFECQTCNWWYELCEEAEGHEDHDRMCEDCAENND
jgi:hypothetical protein